MNRRQLRQVCSLEAVASLDNLFLAAEKARRGKSRRPDVEDWWQHRGQRLGRLREELLSGSYEPGGYRFFEVTRPKRRLIAAAPFEDRVVHHALCNLLAPVLERRFIARSFSCQVGKGTTAARECCRGLTNQNRFVLKCDVRKFFPNNDPANLRCAYRNNNTPDNQNNNVGFRCVWLGVVSPKAEHLGEMPGGSGLPGRSQESSLTAAPAPAGPTGKDAARAVTGSRETKATARFPQRARANEPNEAVANAATRRMADLARTI